MFASKSITEHLVRGLAGFTALVAAFVVMTHGSLWSIPLALVGVVFLRGCPTCWMIGLMETSCGTGKSCAEPVFAKPGKYTAKMCVTPGKLTGPDAGQRQCVTTGPEKCGSVEFDFPSSTVVKGAVGP